MDLAKRMLAGGNGIDKPQKGDVVDIQYDIFCYDNNHVNNDVKGDSYINNVREEGNGG
jgi:hypothetical protein